MITNVIKVEKILPMNWWLSGIFPTISQQLYINIYMFQVKIEDDDFDLEDPSQELVMNQMTDMTSEMVEGQDEMDVKNIAMIGHTETPPVGTKVSWIDYVGW